MSDILPIIHPLSDLEDVFSDFMKKEQYSYLAGVGHWHNYGDPVCVRPEDLEELLDFGCLGVNPLQQFEANLRWLLEVRIPELKNHRHEYDEKGFCSCGWDGSA